MKLFILAGVVLFFSQTAFAGGACVATQWSYKSFCAQNDHETACTGTSGCVWASAGYNACSQCRWGWDDICSKETTQQNCQVHAECFWPNPEYNCSNCP